MSDIESRLLMDQQYHLMDKKRVDLYRIGKEFQRLARTVPIFLCIEKIKLIFSCHVQM